MLEETAKIFKAFCDVKRLRILTVLQEGEHCACQLMERLDIAQSALSYHMKILCVSGIVESWCVGKWTHYRISPQGMQHAQDILQGLSQVQENGTCACEKAI